MNVKLQRTLNELARDYVGDDKTRIYFVTDGGDVVTITTNKDVARMAYTQLASRSPLQECALENWTGVVSSVEPESDEPNARLRRMD